MKKFLSSLFFIVSALVLLFFYGTLNTLEREKYTSIKIFNADSDDFVEDDTLFIMTYNIGWLSGMTNNLPVDRSDSLYSHNLDNCIKTLGSIHQNIIAFQEIDIDANRSFNYNQPDSLGAKLKYSYGALAINWDKNFVPFPGYNPTYFFGKTVSAQYILSDLEILDNAAEKLIKPINAPFYYNAFYLDRLIQKTLIKTQKGNIMVLNVHLEAFDEETRNKHIKRTIEVFDSYKDKIPTLLVGDFNSPQWKEGDRNILLNKLFEMKNVSNAIPDSIYKYNMNKYNTFPSVEPSEKIDFIFYNSDRIRAIDSGVLQEIGSPSDHIPVWMSFIIK